MVRSLFPALLLSCAAEGLAQEIQARQEQPWTKHTIYEGAHNNTAVGADFTGDGQVDVLSSAAGAIRLFSGPSWDETVIYRGPRSSWNCIHSEVMDVDGDGDPDFIGAIPEREVFWLENPGGPARESWIYHNIDREIHGIHCTLKADVDGDGRPDLLVNNFEPHGGAPNSLTWMKVPENPRQAERWERHVLAQGDAPGGNHYFGFGDVDGDGRGDVCVGAKGAPFENGNWFAWWRNPEDPTRPWEKRMIAENEPGATCIWPADLNGDGVMDFLASRGHGQGVVWFEGPDWKKHEIDPGLKGPHCLQVVDMDGDGDRDAVTCAKDDKLAVWYENDGRGVFLPHVVGHDQAAYDIRVLDMDADGDLDMLIAGQTSANVVWYENPGLPRRPNILFAFADDWGRYASAYAGVDGPGTAHEVIKTPHFDRVAREGILFRNAFVTAPSCTPCRSSLLSGQYFWRTGLGAILQGAKWDPQIPSYPLLLREAGYHIGHTYKVWSPGQPADAPYGGREFAYVKAGRRFNQFSQNVTAMVRNGKEVEAAKRELYGEVTGNFEAFLADRKAGQPFCYWFGPTLVHREWVRGSGQALWGIDPESLKGRMPAFLPDVPEVREDLADYFGEIQAFDTALGLLLARLEKLGELDNTLVVVSGDHGPPGFPQGKCNLYDYGTAVPLAVRWGNGPGKPGRVVDDFINLMDLAPTFLEAGGVPPPGIMTGRSFLDVLNSNQSGQVDPARQWVITGRERHVAKARDGELPYPQRALRTKDYLYIVNFEPDRWPLGNPYNIGPDTAPDPDKLAHNTFATFGDMDASPTKAWLVGKRNDPGWGRFYERAFGKRPREELFILKHDPDQVSNVAEDPAWAEVKRRLHEQLMSELKRTEDPRVTGDGKTFERAPFVTGER